MAQVRIGNEVREYPEGTTWLEVAGEYQHFYENDILLVRVNGKLQELHKHVRDCNPVSYTHLDVYKRQLWRSARSPGPSPSPSV